MTDEFAPRLSPLDEQRFGARTAKATLSRPDEVTALLDFCRDREAALAIARCPTREIAVAQVLESHGFFLTDTLVYYRRDLAGAPIPDDAAGADIRVARPEEAGAVGAAAAAAFRGYFGHYHADPRLDPAAADAVYADWAARSCASHETAGAVLVADADGAIGGFAVMKMVSATTGDGLLYGVAPAARGRGLYRSLLIGSLRWCLLQNAREMITSTQITNLVPQQVWASLGFVMSHAYYTLHKWFDSPPGRIVAGG